MNRQKTRECRGRGGRRQFIASGLLVCCGLYFLPGCGGSSDRRSLCGTVTFDGEPLPEGSIEFIPAPGTKGPVAGGKITDGKFTVDSNKGTFDGTFRVEITAVRKTGRKKMDRTINKQIDETQQYIPSRYNRQSGLTADVSSGGSNEFHFELTSK